MTGIEQIFDRSSMRTIAPPDVTGDPVQGPFCVTIDGQAIEVTATPFGGAYRMFHVAGTEYMQFDLHSGDTALLAHDSHRPFAIIATPGKTLEGWQVSGDGFVVGDPPSEWRLAHACAVAVALKWRGLI
jgi:hypothetical protein